MRARRHCKVNVYSKSLANLQTQVSEYICAKFMKTSLFFKAKKIAYIFLIFKSW